MRIKSHAPWMFAGMAAAGVITLVFIGTYIALMRQVGRERVPTEPLTCRLRCVGISRATGRSDVKALSETTWTISTARIHPRSGLPLSLPLPDRGEPTNIDRRTSASVQWQLNFVIPSKAMSEETGVRPAGAVLAAPDPLYSCPMAAMWWASDGVERRSEAS